MQTNEFFTEQGAGEMTPYQRQNHELLLKRMAEANGLQAVHPVEEEKPQLVSYSEAVAATRA